MLQGQCAIVTSSTSGGAAAQTWSAAVPVDGAWLAQ